MKILAFDTATMETSCAILDDEKVIATASVNSSVRHSETLIAMIEDMLKVAGWEIDEIELIATGVGPGSFTGLRISVTLAKILGKALNIPVVGVSTLKALARQVAEAGAIIPIFDARRERVYAGLFEKGKGQLTRLKKDDAYAVADVLAWAPEGAAIIGDGLLSYGEAFASARKDLVLYPPHLSKVSAAAIALEAKAEYELKGACDIYALEPNYLRPSQAMREYRRKHGQSQDA